MITSARYREIVRLEARSMRRSTAISSATGGDMVSPTPTIPRDQGVRASEQKRSPLPARSRRRPKGFCRYTGTGYESIANVGSTRSSLENQAKFGRFCQALGWNEPNYFETSAIAHKVKRAVSRLDDRLAVSMREMERADFHSGRGRRPGQ